MKVACFSQLILLHLERHGVSSFALTDMDCTQAGEVSDAHLVQAPMVLFPWSDAAVDMATMETNEYVFAALCQVE